MKKVLFGELVEYLPKSKRLAKTGSSSGKYPFYSSSAKLSKFQDDFDYDGKCLIFGTGGNASVHYIEGKFSTSTDCIVAKIKNEKDIYSKYVYLYFSSNMKLLESGFKGAGLKHISKGYISDIKIPLPPIDEQIRIANILSRAESLIAKRKETIKMLDEYLKSVFLDMFGDPGKNNKKWPTISLSQQIVDVQNGLTRRRKTSLNSGDIVLRLRDIRKNFIDFSDVNRISLDEKEKNKYAVKANDLLFIRVNGNPDFVGRSSVFLGFKEHVYYNDHIMRVRVNNKLINPVFLCYIINSDYGKRQISLHRKTSAGQHTINQEGLGKILIYLPSIELQNKFVNVVKKVESIITNYDKNMIDLEMFYNLLSQKAFEIEGLK